jgi:hypothetical protein
MVAVGSSPQGKNPAGEPGIEPGASWLEIRSSDYQATRLVGIESKEEKIFISRPSLCKGRGIWRVRWRRERSAQGVGGKT